MITVTGSLAFDFIMDYSGLFADNIMPDKIHKLNLSFYLETLKKQMGGTAGNISFNLSLLKIPVVILAVAGRDFEEYKHFLTTSGVDTSSIQIIESELTATAFIMTDKNDNQIAGFYPGAIKMADSLSLDNLDQMPSFVVISPDNPKAMVKFSKECQKLNIPYLFDPGMQLPTLTNEQLIQGIKGAEIVIGNDYEMELIKQRIGNHNLLTTVKVLITTLGEKGSIIQTAENISPSRSQSPPGRWIIKAAKPTEVVDPTGAGDAYRAGFLAGYMKKLDLKVCGQMGSVTACYAIEKYGTTNHSFSIPEFCKRYKENFGEELTFS